MGGLFGGKPDNSAAMAQIEEQRKENERLKEQAMSLYIMRSSCRV